jgi:cyclophilin family peptidyl-prolyl cis-trans isomerase
MKALVGAALLLTVSVAGAQHKAPRPVVEVTVKSKGKYQVELRPDQAPKLCAHFLKLVDKGFYDRQLFHRKVPNFVIQAGDPQSKDVTSKFSRENPTDMQGTEGIGDGGSGKTVPFELNELRHHRYTIGMALEAPSSDTGDSQFFINLKYNMRLYGKYCVFGKVTKGFKVIDSIDRGDRIISIRRIR